MFFIISFRQPLQLINYSSYKKVITRELKFTNSTTQHLFLLILQSGQATCTQAHQQIQLKEKNWLISDQELLLHLSKKQKFLPEIHILEFSSKQKIQKSLSPFLITSDPDYIALPQIGTLIDLQAVRFSLNHLFISPQDPAYRQNLYNNYLLSNILLFLKEQFLQTAQNNFNNQVPVKFEKIVQWISLHVNDKLTVQLVAHHFSITPEYLTKLFKEYEGMPTLNFIHNLKISRAKDLLITTNMSIKQIGYYLSYDNIKYFMRLFKKKTGFTPSEFRNNFSSQLPVINK